jgi:3-hydroxybenzoate 6-monooxygenase
MASERPILIVGGGIGGLACAIALGRRGIPCRVLEQATEFGEVGAGIQLGPNMLRALGAIGLRERVLADAWLPERLLVRDALGGAQITEIPVGAGFRDRFGEPYALTHRADLLTALLEAAAAEPLVELSSGHRVEAIGERGDRVTAELDSGEELEAEALIGADGIWSRVRGHLIGDGKPAVSGHIAYRAVLPRERVPAELWSPEMTVWVGPRTHLVHYPLRRGELYNLVAVFHSERYSEGYDEAGDVEELWHHFAGECEEVRRLLQEIDVWKYWVLCDREPRRGWSKGRMTVLGDAAHPMLQYLAQGAAMAVEDGVCLAEELAERRGDPVAAFAAYENLRVLRTGKTQIMARVYGGFFHAAGVAAELRDEMLAARTPEDSWEGMAWLYDHQPTRAPVAREVERA